ncbi:MAG: zinc-binding dehydrogenase [Acidimicrobiia bacterium]|nr:zinc-binding dehydrogenase [Acidimicrobiia bacterium]
MTRTVSALVLESAHRLVPREIPLPEVTDDTALLRVEACGLCGTDHEQYTGHIPAGFAFVPGHETVGVVEAIGDAASQRWDVRAGDRVAVEVFQTCRECGPCEQGDYRHCTRHGITDMYGFIPVDREPGLWGGYAEYQFLGPDAICHKVPAGLDPVLATLFNPLGAGVRWGVTLPHTRSGDIVCVLGPGIRGLCTAAAAKDAGAAFVCVTGAGAHDAARLQAARDFGADLTVDVTETDPVDALRRNVGALADIVVDVTAKAPAAFAQSLALARAGGTVVTAGTRGIPDVPGFSPDLIVYKELRILGALGVDAPAYTRALEILAAGRWPFDDLDRAVVGLAGAEALIRLMAGEEEGPRPIHGVICPWT